MGASDLATEIAAAVTALGGLGGIALVIRVYKPIADGWKDRALHAEERELIERKRAEDCEKRARKDHD